ncbi:iron chaperone [Methanomassiliicoccus luminyensis]|uniref:iron chaperone n=1 Tax=Methanomassiliicoccus luminyensis TaxID=1080712 RepID=UPI00036EBADB
MRLKTIVLHRKNEVTYLGNTRPQLVQDDEQKTAKSTAKQAEGESAVLDVIAAMPGEYRAMGERPHAVIMASVPSLTPRLWYGMPAYAKDGKIVCFFRAGEKFKERYMTLGFNDVANLDEGVMWPVAFALKDLTPAEEARIADLVKKAVS